jgi:hypothetical protein
MLDEIKKSIQSVLYERITSPFSGAFIFTWLVWNWKLIYYFFAVDSKIDFSQRISFIQTSFINIWPNLIFPIFSAVFFVLVYPFITTGSMYIWLRFKKWQNEIKNKIENEQLLSLSKSIELRLLMKNQQIELDKLISEKEQEINLLKNENKSLIDQLNEIKKPIGIDKTFETINTLDEEKKETTNKEIKEYELLTSSPFFEYLPTIIGNITRENKTIFDVSSKAVNFFEANGIIERNPAKTYTHQWTLKGKKFLQYIYKNNLIPKNF